MSKKNTNIPRREALSWLGSLLGCALSTSSLSACLSNHSYSDTLKFYPGTSLNKVLFIGIDGCRADAFKEAETPTLDQIMQSGSYSFNAQTENHVQTISGPGWSSIFTGVWSDQHLVCNNNFIPHNFAAYPSLFTRIKETNPEIYTYSLAEWDLINKLINKDADNCYTAEDYNLMEAACWALQHRDYDVISICFNHVDAVGHAYGFDLSIPEYLQAITQIDRYVGQILEVLKARSTYCDENWLFLCTSDHGGYVDYDENGNITGGSHWGGLLESRIIPYITNQSGGEIIPVPTHLDVAPTILTHLGIPLNLQ